MNLSDTAAERAVLSGICKYADNIYLEISDIIDPECFTIDSNKLIFQCIKNLCEENIKAIDIASILSQAKELGYTDYFVKKEELNHLQAVLNFPIHQDNVKKFASKICKLKIARLLKDQLNNAQKNIDAINGSESISHIISLAEDPIFDFTNLISNDDASPEKMGNGLNEYLKDLVENPVDQVGIPTGFPVYDQAIGGGLRKSTINVIAARPKTGKTLLSDNMGLNIASKGIPVLNMDTEMTKLDHINRLIAMMTEVEINKIETGKFADSQACLNKINKAAEDLSKMNFYHKSIAGKSFDEQLSIMKRWIVKDVGLNDDGSAKDCVVFYDYLKLMDTQGLSSDMKEYQLLGFMMTSLHNFASKYKIPIVAFIQLNRDGITKESTDTASGSDRIIWLCSNFTIFKRKSDEEISEDGPSAGNRKLIPIISRHGGGLDDNDYINCHMKGWCAKISEGKTKLELMNNSSDENEGFVIENDKEEIPFA
jgi:replicative DNA helicase